VFIYSKTNNDTEHKRNIMHNLPSYSDLATDAAACRLVADSCASSSESRLRAVGPAPAAGASVAAHEYGSRATWAITNSNTSIGSELKMDAAL
jgi:hypothetical protein